MKKIFRNFIFFLLTIIILFFIIGKLFHYIETPSNYWKDAKSINPEYITSGWIPKWFPKNATKIHEHHDIDTNEVWLKFEFENKLYIPHNFTKLNYKQIKKVKIRKPFLAFWWFEGLIEHQPSNDAALYADIYYQDINITSTYIFIDKQSSTQYIYRERNYLP